MLLLSVSITAVAAGEEAGEQPVSELRPIIVVGSSGDSFSTEDDATGFTQVIHAREAWRGLATVGELLEHAVGLQVRHFGAREDFTVVSVRGSTPNQVRILLDGVSLTRAQSDVVNLADIPLDSVERIEIYRGFTPVRYASSGAASVINLVTRREAPGAYGASVGYGSFDTAKASVHASDRLGAGTLAGFLTYRRTDGDFTFKDDTPDPETNPSGETIEKHRINNDQESWDLLLRYTVPVLVESTLTLTGNGRYKDEGAPGPASNQQPLARYRASRSIVSAALETARGDRFSLDFTHLDETLRDTRDPDSDEPGIGRPPKSDNRTIAMSTGASTSRAVGTAHLLEGAIEGAYERFDGDFDDEDLPERTQQRGRLAVAIGDEMLLAPRFVLTPQLRFESVWNDFEGDGLFPPIPSDQLPDEQQSSVDPRLGMRIEATPELTVKANISTYFRPPNFGELFGDDGFSTANPALEPEQGTNRDIGFVWSKRRLGPIALAEVEYAYFNNDVDNMIVFITSGSRIPRPQNVGRARVRGHELRLNATLPRGFSLESNYTRQDAENRTPFPELVGKDLPSLPRDEAFARFALDRERWSIAYELGYRSSVFLDQANLLADERVPAHTVHGLTLELRPFSTDLAVRIEGLNLGDEQVSDVVGFPSPGRAFFVSLSYGWSRKNDD